MVHSQSEPTLAAFDDFRQISRNLIGLDAEGQVPFLKYELLQALDRAADFRRRNRDLERQIEELENRFEVAQRPTVAERVASELAAESASYEERLRTVEGAYQAMKRRCGTLEEWCRSLLLTIEHAACLEGADHARVAVPPPPGASLHGEPGSQGEPMARPEGEPGPGDASGAARLDDSQSPGAYASGVAATLPMEAP